MSLLHFYQNPLTLFIYHLKLDFEVGAKTFHKTSAICATSTRYITYKALQWFLDYSKTLLTVYIMAYIVE